MIHSLHKSYTADLEQIIRVFAASLKTFDHAEYKTQVSLDIFLSCFFVSGFDPFKKLCFLLLFQKRKFRSIYPAQFYFVYYHRKNPPKHFILRMILT